MANRIKLAMSLYGDVSGIWLMHFLNFMSQIEGYKARHGADRWAGMVLSLGTCYVHSNVNDVVAGALEDEDWDYLLIMQQDMVMPEGLMERIGSYTEPIVGVLYFGRTQENQTPIPGYWNQDAPGFHRMTADELDAVLEEPGIHPCDVVGLGCTAIRRDVFENWDPERVPWFQIPSTPEIAWGEDVWFCKVAAELGYATFVDTAYVAGHIGTWISTQDTHMATRDHQRRKQDSPPIKLIAS